MHLSFKLSTLHLKKVKMVSEIAVTVKNDDKTLTKKELIYEPYAVHEEDPTIKALMDETVKEFNAEVESVKVKITMEVK